MGQPICSEFTLDDRPAERLQTFSAFCSQTIAASHDTTRAMSAILDFIVNATDAVGASIAMPEGHAFAVSASTHAARYRRGERIPMNSGVFGAAFSKRETYLSNSTIDPRADVTRSYARLGTTIVSPIMHGRRAYGLLIATYPAAHGVHATQARDVRDFTSIAGCILGDAIYEREREVRSSPDPQTGLESRRAFDRQLKAQYDLYRRFGVPFSLALFDFDEQPHATTECARALRGAMRASDAAFRVSENMLAVVLKNCSESDGETALARLDRAMPFRGVLTVAAPRLGENLRALRQRAERSLLQGRGRAIPTRAA
ncbi:MAG TPA: GGDEF domain-containing protein [Candidatus Baltobacteraceae bacterium]|jgi:GGDEF domain-containing protein|nr:GGDEF domain-containing protein [Candidatus Baltobacteraceae bacterium]